MCRLNALQALELSNASFTGPVSLNASGFSSLKSFTAFNNKLTGPLPTALPVNLTTLGVGGNQINGTLPAYNSSTLGTFQVRNQLSLGSFRPLPHSCCVRSCIESREKHVCGYLGAGK